MKNARLAFAVILAQLLPFAAHAETCSQVYVKSPSAVTVFNKTPKTLWVNMGDMPSKGKEGLAYGYKTITPGQAVCFGMGVRGAGFWVREAGQDNALFFKLADYKVRAKLSYISKIEVMSEAGFVATQFKHQVREEVPDRREVSKKLLQVEGRLGEKHDAIWVDYVAVSMDGSVISPMPSWVHEQDPRAGRATRKKMVTNTERGTEKRP